MGRMITTIRRGAFLNSLNQLLLLFAVDNVIIIVCPSFVVDDDKAIG